MEDFVAALAEWAFELGWRGGLILAAGALGLVLCRRRPAAVRHALITGAVMVLLTLPLLRVVLPEIELPVPAPEPATFAESPPRFFLELPALSRDSGASDFRGETVVAVSTGFTLSDPKYLIGILWCLGTLFLSLRLLAGYVQFWALRRRCIPVRDTALKIHLEQCCRRLGIRRPPKLFLSRDCSIPFSAGILRPSLVLPRDATSWGTTRRRWCFSMSWPTREDGTSCFKRSHAWPVPSTGSIP